MPHYLTNNRFQVKNDIIFSDSYREVGLFFISFIAKLHEEYNELAEIASRCIDQQEKIDGLEMCA